MNEKLQKLYAKSDLLFAKVNEFRAKETLTEAEQTEYKNTIAEAKKVEAEIDTEKEVEALAEKRNQAENKPFRPAAEPKRHDVPRLFNNFGDQLKAVKDVATGVRVDDRLIQINNALGGNEGIGADGGFAVQTDFAGMMLDTAAKSGEILSRVDSYQISGNADGVKWNDIDESSVATTVFGGVQVYWAAEAASVTATKPKIREKKLALEKLMGVAYATYELEQDSNFVSQLYTRAFEVAIQRTLESAIVSGDGIGKPTGFLTGAALVQVAKEAGQAAATVNYTNIAKMYNRILDKSNGVWVLHPDVQEQLEFLEFPVGVGGVPVYLPASSQGTLNTLKGKPIVESDQCSAVGALGDINFIDLKQYLLIYKGGIDTAASMHVQFLTAENCFRFIFRANGIPKYNNTMTIKNSSNARSHYIGLAARA
jgi:HK97 family phage major capsid protein